MAINFPLQCANRINIKVFMISKRVLINLLFADEATKI